MLDQLLRYNGIFNTFNHRLPFKCFGQYFAGADTFL